MIYLRLFIEFFRAGLFAIGGGLATLPFLYDISDRTGWFSHADLADMVAVSESTPGPIGINMATYVGFTTGGPAGSVIATLGLIAPSIIVIIIIAHFLKKFSESPAVKGAFYGLRPASVGLIAAACFLVVKIALLDTDAFQSSGSPAALFRWNAVILAVVLYLLMKYQKKLLKLLGAEKPKDLHPFVYLAASAVIGIIFRFAGA